MHVSTAISSPETRGRALARQARHAGNLDEDELLEFGGWLLDVMSRLIVVQDDQIVDMELRQLAQDAFHYNRLSPADQQTLGIWVETELDALRLRDRRATGRSDRRTSQRGATAETYLDVFVKTVEAAGFDWAIGRDNGSYAAIIAKAPATLTLTSPDIAHGPTPADALRVAMRRADLVVQVG